MCFLDGPTNEHVLDSFSVCGYKVRRKTEMKYEKPRPQKINTRSGRCGHSVRRVVLGFLIEKGQLNKIELDK